VYTLSASFPKEGLAGRKGLTQMTRHFLLFACAFALTVSALGQTKASGTIDCDKSDPVYAIPVPDREGYAYVISQTKCAWIKSIVIEGLDPKGHVVTNFYEVMGASSRSTASGITTYSNGDKVYSSSSSTIAAKALSFSGKWTFSGGTGKLNGIKGGGTFTCKLKSAEPGAGGTCEIVGDYNLPVAGKQ
jgi:hypothetical protein